MNTEGQARVPNASEYILEYFKTIDSALEKLSHRQEGKINKLPSWVLVARDICIGTTIDGLGCVIKVTPNPSISDDTVTTRTLSSTQDIAEIMSPYSANFSPGRLSRSHFVMFGDVSVTQADNPLAEPALDNRLLIGWGKWNEAIDPLSVDSAKKSAVDLWNSALHDMPTSKSFIRETNAIFAKFDAIIRRKAFFERKIHRYIKEHADLLLPPFSRLLYEHSLFLDCEEQVADFILERESGFPPLLVELESPVHKALLRNGDLSREANHAKAQISRWVNYIDQAPDRNATGEYAFLRGPKQRLVIIGRGLEHREALLQSRWDDSLVWTYDLLLEQAKSRWNNDIATQCKLIGCEELRPFR